MSGNDREILTWDLFGQATRELAAAIHADGFRPDVVVAIARGGLTVAGALAYALDVKNCGAMNVEFYIGIDQRLDVPGGDPARSRPRRRRPACRCSSPTTSPTPATPCRLVREVLAQHVAEARTAVLYRKPALGRGAALLWRETDRWIDFPWSVLPPVTAPGVERP